MKQHLLSCALVAAVCGAPVLAGPVTSADPAARARQMLAAGQNGLIGGPDAGADVIVGELMRTQSSNGSMTLNLTPASTVGAVSAYGIGTTSCNIGTANLLWIASNNQHPVIAQNMYRLKDGRLEQIGIGWLKHGFTALTYNACNLGCNGVGGSQLGIGCSDPYSASLNASQSNLGPRYQVNASTGFFPYPYASHPNVNGLSKRVQIQHSDIEDSVQFPNTRYFAEGIYITPDDTAAGNNANNASYRRMTVNGTTREFFLTDQTERTKPAIHAWKDYGLNGSTDPDVTIMPVDIAGDGRFWYASKATNLGGGMWHYEMALFNLTSDRSAGSFSVTVPACATVTNIGFHDIDYHSGEPFDPTDWTATRVGDQLKWTSPQTYAQNTNSNALRWGTMYNFRFDANIAPVSGANEVGIFKPPTAGSTATSFSVTGMVPKVCKPDFNGDCILNLADFGAFQTAFALGDPKADYNGDGQFNLADFGAFQTGFAIGCN